MAFGNFGRVIKLGNQRGREVLSKDAQLSGIVSGGAAGATTGAGLGGAIGAAAGIIIGGIGGGVSGRKKQKAIDEEEEEVLLAKQKQAQLIAESNRFSDQRSTLLTGQSGQKNSTLLG